jgi:hypothetical protein
MRMLATGIMATAILDEASVAFAAGITGTIKSLDPGKDTITLHNGSTYMAPKSVKFSDLKVGEKVTVSYAKAGDKMGITSIKPAT